jgi:anthranilate phosphoribosyltransferase
VNATAATLEKLLQRFDLEETEAAALLRELTREELEPALAAAILAALRAKGETAAELRGFATAMRGLASKPQLRADGPLLDIVGTGGDASGSLNLSTGASLLAAACGIPVAKHGNRSISSRCGSADLLEALGMRLPPDPAAAASCLEATGYTFLFAPYFHPAMKALGPVRRAMGVRTVFNLLGPLTNPASPPFLLLGAYSPAAARLMADAIAGFQDLERGFVVHGTPGWDEATPVGPFLLFEVRGGKVRETSREPGEWGIPRCTAEDLAGGDAAFNASRLSAVFAGHEEGPHLDALLLGAALALELTGLASTPATAMTLARDALREGRAAALVAALGRQGTEAKA